MEVMSTATVRKNECRTYSPKDMSVHYENMLRHQKRIVPIDVKIRLELVARSRQFTQLQLADQRNILDCIEMLKVFEE